MEQSENKFDQVFRDNNFMVFTAGSLIGGGSISRNTLRIKEITYTDLNRNMLAKVVSTDPRTDYVRDRMAMFTSDGSKILSIDVDVKSHHGFLPKVKHIVKNLSDEEYCNLSYDKIMLPYIEVNNDTVVYTRPANSGLFDRFNYGIHFYSNDTMVSKIEQNKTSAITFNGYSFEILDRSLLKYIIPCSIGWLKDFGMISSTL